MIPVSDSAQIIRDLRRGLCRAIDSYRSFQQSDIPTDAKGFSAYHQACKAALNHIALLMKLIPPESQPPEQQTDWLALARAANRIEDTQNDLFID